MFGFKGSELSKFKKKKNEMKFFISVVRTRKQAEADAAAKERRRLENLKRKFNVKECKVMLSREKIQQVEKMREKNAKPNFREFLEEIVHKSQ